MTRESFLDLDDYGRDVGPDFCSRVGISVEIDGPSDYYTEVWDYKSGEPLAVETLTIRDQKRIERWVKGEVEDYLSGFYDLV